VQKTDQGDLNRVIETKGRVWEETAVKDAAIQDWRDRITERTGNVWKFFRINQTKFDAQIPKTLEEAIRSSHHTVNALL